MRHKWFKPSPWAIARENPNLKKDAGSLTVYFYNYETGITSWSKVRIGKREWHQKNDTVQAEVIKLEMKNLAETLLDELDRLSLERLITKGRNP